MSEEEEPFCLEHLMPRLTTGHWTWDACQLQGQRGTLWGFLGRHSPRWGQVSVSTRKTLVQTGTSALSYVPCPPVVRFHVRTEAAFLLLKFQNLTLFSTFLGCNTHFLRQQSIVGRTWASNEGV